jgi:hypothetical protein
MRPLTGDTEPSICMCDSCQVPMEEGDHSGCMIELLACPEHMDEQLRQMGYEPGTANMPQPMGDMGASMFTDSDGNPIVGFCLWCDKDFYSFEEAEAHNANDSAACPVFQQMKDDGGMPPVLQMMLEDAGVPDEGDDGTEPESKE